jgi:hypothetical protein
MTNAEFLNENFGTNYKAWMKCRWKYSSKLQVWMLEFDDKVRYGWKNDIVGNKIIENYVEPLSNMIDAHKDFYEEYRLVVDKSQNFKVLGVYKFDKENSNKLTHRIWVKVSNSIEEMIDKI